MSTLLQLLNGLLRPTKGTIQFEDFVLDDHSGAKEMKYLRKKVGLGFQFPESQLFAETVLADSLWTTKILEYLRIKRRK